MDLPLFSLFEEAVLGIACRAWGEDLGSGSLEFKGH